MKTFVIVTLVTIVLLAFGGFAYAKYKGVCSGPEGRSKWMVERVTHRLELNPGQQEKLERLRLTLLDARSEFVQSRSSGKAALADLLSAPTLDRIEVRAKVEEQRSRIDNLAPRVIDAVAAFTDSLDAGQRERVVAWLEKRGHGRFGWGH